MLESSGEMTPPCGVPATVAVTWGYASRPILAARAPTLLVDRLEAILDCFG